LKAKIVERLFELSHRAAAVHRWLSAASAVPATYTMLNRYDKRWVTVEQEEADDDLRLRERQRDLAYLNRDVQVGATGAGSADRKPTIGQVGALYDAGHSLAQVAAELGLSAESVRQTMARHHIPRRGHTTRAGCGRSTDKDGHGLVHDPNYPEAVNGYVREHRLVIERAPGRRLLPEEVVQLDGISHFKCVMATVAFRHASEAVVPR